MISSSSTVLSLSSKHDIELVTKEPEWLHEFRAKVWNAFQILPLESDPNLLNFLQTKILNEFQFSYPPPPIANPKTNLKPTADTKIEFKSSPELEEITISDKYATNSQITFQNLFSLISSSEFFIDLLNSLMELKINDKLLAAALTTLDWGTYLKIDSNASFNETINVTFETSGSSIKSGLHIIDIKDNVNATINLTYDSHNNIFDHSVTYILTSTNSHVNILINELGLAERKTNRGFITKIGKDSSVNFAQVQVDGSYVRQRAEFYFTEEGGDLVEVACLSAHNKQDYDFYSAIYHLTPRCNSRAYARGVNDNDSRTIFKGKVDIGKKGAKVNTDLSLHGLLLSKKAKFHSFPAMEVVNNDVVATHGASVSQIDQEQIFYFQTRGIDRDNAEYMIASGYFEPAISRIRSSNLQDQVRAIISKAVDEQFHKNQ